MTRPTTLILAALVLQLPGAAVRAGNPTAAPPPVAADLRPLQGTWEGVHVGQESAGTITITFSGDTLHFQGVKADQRYDASFTLQKGTRPRQLRATITGSEIEDSVGEVIGAVFKIENGTLSLAGIDDDAPATLDDAEAFDGNGRFHYRLRKVVPPAKTACAPTPGPSPSPSWAPWNPLERPGSGVVQ